ncbi:MAG: hypothetical protein HYX81_01230 [Chloroflexi bacterium]|nr:hypothetical protein [Chloroflexota bacterium]
MSEFLRANASWIVFGLLLLVMMWMHTRGYGGCGMGHEHKDAHNPEMAKDKEHGGNSPGWH